MINVDPVRHQSLPMREAILFDDEKQGCGAVPFRQNKIFVEIFLTPMEPSGILVPVTPRF